MGDETLSVADITEILRLLPHRYPFLLIDRVIDIRGDHHGNRHQERDDQRGALCRALSRQSDDARRLDGRRLGADRGRPGTPADAAR